jgi:hypothetical protein
MLAALAGGGAAGRRGPPSGRGPGFAIDLVLLGILAFAIKAICWLCVATYAVNAAILVILLPVRRGLAAAGGLTSGAAGRLVLTSWIVAGAGPGAGVHATEIALRAWREAGDPAFGARAVGTDRHSQHPPPQRPRASSAVSGGSCAADRAGQGPGDHRQPRQANSTCTEGGARVRGGATYSLKLDGVPRKGPDNAAIKVVEFSDFMCPYCRNLAGAFESFLPQSGGRINLYFKNYPLDTECNSNLKQPVHVGSCLLARGGICAQEQGKFWPYHNRVSPRSCACSGRGAEDGEQLAREVPESCTRAGHWRGDRGSGTEAGRPAVVIDGKLPHPDLATLTRMKRVTAAGCRR